jgi:predicted protein tyrosine phosphatase
MKKVLFIFDRQGFRSTQAERKFGQRKYEEKIGYQAAAVEFVQTISLRVVSIELGR